MPRGDGTGPGGLGPMTGRAAGFCAGNSMPGFTNPVSGRGGFSGGRGRGLRNRYWATGQPRWAQYNAGAFYPDVFNNQAGITAKQEADALRNQVQYFQNNLNALNERIQELEKLEAEDQKPKK